jgi:hypothetical protein
VSGAIHGRISASSANRYVALEDPPLPPFPDVEAARRAFAVHLAILSEWRRERGQDPVIPPAEHTEMWTLYLLGRRQEWWDERTQQHVEVIAAIDAVPVVA